jgi:DNA translocase FtsK/SpoIIIE-like protein
MPESRKVVGPGLWEQPPPTLQPTAAGSRWEAFIRLVVRPTWGLRVEILTGIAGAVLWSLCAQSSAAGPVLAVLVVAFVGACLRWPALRKRVLVVFHRSRLRRRWNTGVRHAGLATHNDRVPTPVKVSSTPSGDLLRVRIPAGSNAGLLAAEADTIAAFLGVREVRVERDRDNARFASVRVVSCDPLSGGPVISWRNLDALRLSVWEAIPVGIDEDGEVVYVSLPEHNVLYGGEPGAGKSVALSTVVATAALDPSVVLWLLDGKMVELAVWKGCAHRFVGADMGEAIEVLKELLRTTDERLALLMERRKRKVEPGDGLALHVLVVDELAFYCRKPRPQGPEFTALLQDLVSRGRAAGVIVVAATQKPSHNVIDTSLRDLFSFRWALRCSTRDASDTILGTGWATQGYSAATIDAADRGVGFLLHEGGRPVRMKSCYLSDADLETLAARAEALRAASDASPVPAGAPPMPAPDELAAVVPIGIPDHPITNHSIADNGGSQ